MQLNHRKELKRARASRTEATFMGWRCSGNGLPQQREKLD